MTDLEQQVSNAIQKSLAESIDKALSGYGSPLHKIIEKVVVTKSSEIESFLRVAVDKVTFGPEFQEAAQTAISHKVAKLLIAKTEGELEKTVNELKSDPRFRAELTVLVSDLVKKHRNQ